MAARRTRTIVGAIVFAVSVAAFARVPLLPDIGVDLSLTAAEIGLLTTAFGLGRLLMDLPAGRLAAAVEPTLALAGAGIGLAISAALLASAGSIGVAMAASALIGCSSALTNTTGMYAFATATTAERRGASMAIYTTALMLGQMVGPALGGALGSLTDWRLAIGASAVVGLGVAITCANLRRRAPRSSGDRPLEAPKDASPPPPGSPVTRAELIALAAAPFATFFGMAGLTQTLIPLIGAGELDLSASTIGFAIGGGAAARFVSAWVAGVASDRWSRKAVLVPLLIVMAGGAGLLALPISPATWFGSIVALAVGSSGISVAAAGVADRVDPRRLGHELGVFRLLGDLGLLVGPVVTAFLYQDFGPRSAAFASVGVFALAALTAALWVKGASGGRPGAGEVSEPMLP